MFTLALILGCVWGGWQLNNVATNMSSSTKKAITGSISDKLDAVKAKLGGAGE